MMTYKTGIKIKTQHCDKKDKTTKHKKAKYNEKE